MPLVHFFDGGLFDDPASPLPAFQRSFEAWLQHARRSGAVARDSSEEVYRHLWSMLTKWCIGQDPPVRLEALSSADLKAFIASRSGAQGPDEELSPRYVWRLLHLVHRVLQHQRQTENRPRAMGASHSSPAAELLESRPDWQYANAALADPLPEHLNAAQARRLVSFLSEARPRAGAGPVQGLAATATATATATAGDGAKASAPTAVKDTGERPYGGLRLWQELRNRASVALQLGAGLSPGDVRAMRVDGVVADGGRQAGLPWKLRVAADGLSPEREAPIAAWAAQLLRHWLQVRTEAGIAGEWLFPSTHSGKPWGKVAQYQAVKLVLGGAGFDDEVVRGGSFRLRHTFALRQLRRGRTPEEVARWLGVTDPAVMTRYQRVLIAPVDGLV
jgi:integrase